MRAGMDLFIESPFDFYGACLERAERQGLNDLALFTVSCKYCGKPMVPIRTGIGPRRQAFTVERI